ncbi:hypothetical protein JL722_3950 [Aureococcus anophagefferens]|nr:hypothetical protein JL722_3950 [Aureococcus anophagefferens]
MAASDNVRVCVRLRPLSTKEADAGASAVVTMRGDTVRLGDQAFAFDHCFDSSDAASAAHASQASIWETLEPSLVASAIDGFNVSLFAYGQTGSGKSFTMFGDRGDRGVVPRFCSSLFEKLARASPAKTTVAVSMLEIYNERLRDLLVPYARDAPPLKLRDARGIESDAAPDEKHRRSSTVHLVDLAGSERNQRTEASGQRLRESSHINRSLSALSNVISALTTESTTHVPYRDSVLTHLLKDSLGGNARTTMVATVSPASDSASETASTLRYAERSKNIKNKAVVNDVEVKARDAVVKQLRDEVSKLKRELAEERLKAQRVAEEVANARAPSPEDDKENLTANGRVQRMRERMKREMRARVEEYEAALDAASWEDGGLVTSLESLDADLGNVFYVSTREHCDAAGAWDARLSSRRAAAGSACPRGEPGPRGAARGPARRAAGPRAPRAAGDGRGRRVLSGHPGAVVAGPPPDGRWASLRVRAAVAEDRGARTPRVWSPAALAAALDGPGAGGDLAPTADRAGVAGVHLEPLLHLLDIRGALNVADLRGRTVATLDCRVGVAPRGAPGGLAALLGGDVEVTVALALRDLALDAGDAPVLAYQFFDRPLTVALAGVGGGVDHAETFLLPVTPDLLRYVAADALLVEARLVPAGWWRGVGW